MSDLSAAHQGYFYQDLTVAFAFAMALSGSVETVTVERKASPGDRFDDLIIRGPDNTVHRQIKWSQEGSRTLELSDFIGSNSEVRIDRLILSFLSARTPESEPEVRLAVAWNAPIDKKLCSILGATEAPPTIPGSTSSRFRLRAEQIWPEGERPSWRPLREADQIDRADFVAFANRFVIETNTPSFSANLYRPGELERLLLRFLVDRIGIGEYPNEGRRPEDVAARLIVLATRARTEHATFAPEDLAREIGLRIDYGRVEQHFPVDDDHLVVRRYVRDQLQQAIKKSQIVAVVGPPGSGKSWELSALAEELRESGILVARHYCYLEPGDPDVERRITINALFGNLISELLFVDSTLVKGKLRTYAATHEELEGILRVAAEKYGPDPVVLIVDGVDHISRVLASSRIVAAEDTDIIEELAALSLPSGVRLVLGSQPGSHLDPLTVAACTIFMPKWHNDEIWNLAERFGLPARIAQVDNPNQVRLRLAECAEGNPLYATFLVRGLLEALQRAAIPSEWLEVVPPLSGDIANYYSHLYKGASADEQIVAETLGVIDFGVSRSELGNIVGDQIAQHLQGALQRFQPILVDVTGQGGLRVFHESYRRFILERLSEKGLSADHALARVIKWLESLGFEKNAKAYRFLLPALRRADRVNDLLNYVKIDFVSKGVFWGHSREAIKRNLSLATEVAAVGKKWPELIRCSELHRALYTCFEEHLYDPLPYWETFLKLFGAGVLAERLLFEGTPTMSRNLGLVLCSLIDDAGTLAPWNEYLALPYQAFSRSEGRQDDVLWIGQVISAILHGRLRLGRKEDVLDWAKKELLVDPELEGVILRSIADRLASNIDGDSFDSLLRTDSIASDRRAALLLARARLKKRQGDEGGAVADAEAAVSLKPVIKIAEEALDIGISTLPPDLHITSPGHIDIGLARNRDYVDEEAVKACVQSVRLFAHLSPDRLDSFAEAVKGEGWYRSWLNYVIQISKAEALARTDIRKASSVAASAFKELSRDADPFLGKPRAVDLGMIRRTILETVARGLSLLSSKADFASALQALEQAIDGTSAYLQGFQGGPIEHEAFAELLEPYSSSRPELKKQILETLRTRVDAAEKRGEYYTTHAELEFRTIRALVAMGEREKAFEHWHRATVYLAAYGFRKDVTLHQLIEGLPALPHEMRLDALERLFPLADAVVDHTDGKETRYLPKMCIRELAAIEPAAALELAARSQLNGGGSFGWLVEEAAAECIQAAFGLGDTHLVLLANSTFRFAPGYDEDAASEVVRFLEPIKKIGATSVKLAAAALRLFASRVEGDYRRDLLAAWVPLNEVAAHLSIKLTRPSVHVGPEGKSPESKSEERIRYESADGKTLLEAIAVAPLPPVEATPFQLMTWVRDTRHTQTAELETAHADGLVNRIGFNCITLAAHDLEDSAVRLLHYISRQIRMYGTEGAVPLADLGVGFERYGLRRLAAIAYSLAFVRSRGGGGWDSIGGDEHSPWFKQALTLDLEEARRTLTAEVARLVQNGYVMGVTPGLIKRIADWGDQDIACACWEEAYCVVNHRLPLKRGMVTPLLPFRRTDLTTLSVDEALVAIIAARVSHPELDRKRSALLALAQVIQSYPDVARAPLALVLAVGGAPTSGYLLLLSLLLSEQAPYSISRGLAQTIYEVARSDCCGERIAAKMLLERAGLPKPGIDLSGDVVFVKPTEPRHVQATLNLDWGSRVEAICSLWPDFQAALVRQFEQLHFESKASQQRCGDHLKYRRRDDSTMEFWTPILGWEQEMFELAFHKALNGVSPYLWSRGENTANLDQFLFDRTSPNFRLQLAIDASRSVRPAGRCPKEMEREDEPIPIFSDEDEFKDWRRVGWYERELVFKENDMRWGNPVQVIYAASGIVAVSPSIDKCSTPFGRCDVNEWFLTDKPARYPSIAPLAVRGPVIGATMIRDFLGSRMILALPRVFAYRYKMISGHWPGPLRWLCASKEPAVAFRMWRVRAIAIENEEPSVLEGCELIVRPDIFERIERDIGNKIVFSSRPLRRCL